MLSTNDMACSQMISRQSKVLMFIDSQIDDLSQFIEEINSTATIYILDPNTDGVQQITNVLLAHQQVQAIHIVSHGSPGCLYLGNTELSLRTYQSYKEKLALWSTSKTQTLQSPSLYLYGCNLASGDAGSEFIHHLHSLTHLPVFASQSVIGHSSLDGNWNFETVVGTHQHPFQIPLDASVFENYVAHFNVRLVQDINPALSDAQPENLTAVEDRLFFSADDGQSGRELWVSDGTEEGTQLVKDINPSTNPDGPRSLTAVGDKLFFTIADGTTGEELWVSDGTEAGTRLVKDINPTNTSDYSVRPTKLTAVGNRLFFNATDGEARVGLWVSDGTENGTKPVNPDGHGGASELAEFRGQLFFSASDREIGQELWATDDTEVGTRLVKDIFFGEDSAYGSYFPGSSSPKQLTVVDETLFFTAEAPRSGRQLWATDGTEVGTRLVKQIDNRGFNDDAKYLGGPTGLTKVGDQLFFSAFNDATGDALWVTDGTEEGTQLVKDINPDRPYRYEFLDGLSPEYLTEVNSQLFFSAGDNMTGPELWVSNGTEEGTRLVKDINPGISYDSPKNLTEASGLLFFSIDDNVTGEELWISDGTEAGTKLVVDLLPGDRDRNGTSSPRSSSPEDLTVVGDSLFFTATSAQTGRELWVVDLASIPESLELSIPETSPLGSLVEVVAGDNTFTGLISGNNDIDQDGILPFDFDPITGSITVQDPGDLNFEATSSFTLKLSITDPAALTDTQSITINLIDKHERYGTQGDDKIDTRSQLSETGIVAVLRAGNDTVFPTAEGNVLLGGAGVDTLNYSQRTRKVNVNFKTGKVNPNTPGRDVFSDFENVVGTSLNDVLIGDDKNNRFTGGDGNDLIFGDRGIDTAVVIDDADIRVTDSSIIGTFTDQISSIEKVILKGGDSDNQLDASSFSGQAILQGNGGSNTLTGGANSVDLVSYQSDTDRIVADFSSGIVLKRKSETDSLTSIEGIIGSQADDVLNGDSENNLFWGLEGDDIIRGGGGTDRVTASLKQSGTLVLTDKSLEGQGSDTLASIEEGVLSGSDENDILNAFSFSGDWVALNGKNGDDNLIGSRGNDKLSGGMGNDILSGGQGRNIFAYTSPNEGGDVILDFDVLEDVFHFNAKGFGGGLNPRIEIKSNQFVIGTSPTTGNTRFIYNNVNGLLSFDRDGTGTLNESVAIAQLTPQLDIGVKNFNIV